LAVSRFTHKKKANKTEAYLVYPVKEQWLNCLERLAAAKKRQQMGFFT